MVAMATIGDFEFCSLAAGTYAYIVLNGYDDMSDSDAGHNALTITVSVWCLARVKSRRMMTSTTLLTNTIGCLHSTSAPTSVGGMTVPSSGSPAFTVAFVSGAPGATTVPTSGPPTAVPSLDACFHVVVA